VSLSLPAFAAPDGNPRILDELAQQGIIQKFKPDDDRRVAKYDEPKLCRLNPTVSPSEVYGRDSSAFDLLIGCTATELSARFDIVLGFTPKSRPRTIPNVRYILLRIQSPPVGKIIPNLLL
jgi:hypothetical protein